MGDRPHRALVALVETCGSRGGGMTCVWERVGLTTTGAPAQTGEKVEVRVMKKNAMVDLGDDMDEGAVVGEGLKVRGAGLGDGRFGAMKLLASMNNATQLSRVERTDFHVFYALLPGVPEAYGKAAVADAQVGVQGALY